MNDSLYVLQIAKQLLTSVFNHYDSSSKHFIFPKSPATGYSVTEVSERAETFVRSFILAVPIIIREPDLKINGMNVKELFLEQLISHTDKNNELYLNVDSSKINQITLEASMLALCLLESKIFNELSTSNKDQVLNWFELFSNSPIFPNNWQWARIFINLFLKLNGRNFIDYQENLEFIMKELYVIHGWYKDGKKYDLYSAWSMQWYPIFLLKYDPDITQEQINFFSEKNNLFLKYYAHFFSKDGRSMPWGRSQIYRFAASAPYAVAFNRNPEKWIDPGFARHIVVNNIKQFVSRPEIFTDTGLLSLGFLKEDKNIVDDYSCSASPLWAAKTFWCLNLPDDNIFWNSKPSLGFWEQKKQEELKYPFGMKLTHVNENSILDYDQIRSRPNTPLEDLNLLKEKDHRYIGPFSTNW